MVTSCCPHHLIMVFSIEDKAAITVDVFRLFIDSSVTIYLDNEDDSGISFSFPTAAELDVEKKAGAWQIGKRDMKIKFDTSEY